MEANLNSRVIHRFGSGDIGGYLSWLVGCFGFNGTFETVFQSTCISGRLPEGEKEKKKKNRREKNVQTTPTRTYTASAIDPCPTIIQTSRTPQHRKFTQHLRTTRPPGDFQCWGILLIWIGKGPTVIAVGAGGVV